MKKLFFVLLIMLAISVSGQKISKTYSFNNYSIQQVDDYNLLKIKNTRNMAAPGNPMQPYFLTNLLLPPGADVKSVTIEPQNLESEQITMQLYPMQYVRPLSFSGESTFIKHDDAYDVDLVQTFQKSISFHQEKLNGYEIVQVKFSPIQYYPLRNLVEIAKQVTICVNYETNRSPNIKMLSTRNIVGKTLLNLIDNSETIKAYPVAAKKSQIIDVLIITPTEFTPDFEPLIADYQKRALRVEIVSVEDIQAEATGADLQEKIRNTIIEYYQTNDVRYVLLGGDVEHIPYRGFYCEAQSSELITDYDIPADLYYMALDGNWNTDGDDKWGEPDEDDLLPEVALSRMPFSTHEDLQNMLHKTLSYTNYPVEGELNNPLLAGEHLYDDPLTWGAQYLDLIHGTHDDNGYTTTGIPNDHPYDTLYDRDSDWTSTQIIAEINSGHPFIHHVGHSNSNYAMRLYNSDITTSNFSQVDGITHNFPIIYTHGCICGAFDDNDCIAEEMLQLDMFASAFVGNSRYGWFNEGQTEGPSEHLHREFVNALYNDKINFLAEAHMISKIESSGWVEADNQHEPGALRWVFYDCNAMGDPTLPIWTDELKTVDISIPDGLLIGSSQASVMAQTDSNPQANVYISLAKDGVIYGSGTTDASGLAEIQLSQPFTTTGQVEVIYSGYNIVKDTILETLQRPQEGYLVVSEVNLGGAVQPIYGNSYDVDLLIENVGENTSAINALVITTDCEFATINADEITINAIDGMQNDLLSQSFELLISDVAPDQCEVILNFDFYVNGELNHSMQTRLYIQAPKLRWDLISIDDEEGGNNNGIFEMGEILNVEANLSNTGSVNPQMIKSYFADMTNNIRPLNDTVFYTPDQENEYTLKFAIEALPEAQSNQVVSFTLSGKYDAFDIPDKEFQMTLGLAKEDFETGDFTKFDWQNDDSIPWNIQSSEVYEGAYSAMSGDIDNDQSSELDITLNVPENDSISFMCKVSCEDGYSTLWDYLEFSIDGNSMGTWDGISDWTEVTYPVSAGSHTFKWDYIKDGSVSEGEDCIWLDNIILPIPGYEPPTDNSPPEITSNNIVECTTGQPFSHIITATDDDGDLLEAHLILAPEWAQISEQGEGEWQLSGNLPVGTITIPNIIIGVTDGYEFTSQRIVMNINELSITDQNTDQSWLMIYPQPADKELNFETKALKCLRMIAIYNSIGQLMRIKNVSQTSVNTCSIDISKLKQGVYFVSVLTIDGEKTDKKIIIE